jgi:uncharacterized HAD superfamily protein
MKIAIDIDGVLLNIMSTFLKIFNNRYCTSYKIEDVTNWEFFKDWNISEEEAFDIFYNIYQNTMDVPFIDEMAPEYLGKLHLAHEVYILSTRDPLYRSQVEKKLEFHKIKQNIQYIDLILIHNKPYDSKSSQEFDVFVDDNPHLAEAILKKKDKYLLLYDQPWNKSFLCKNNIIRVYNWKDIYETINVL